MLACNNYSSLECHTESGNRPNLVDYSLPITALDHKLFFEILFFFFKLEVKEIIYWLPSFPRLMYLRYQMTESFKLRQAEPLFDGWECTSVTSQVSPTSLRSPPPKHPPNQCVCAWASQCQLMVGTWRPKRSTLHLHRGTQHSLSQTPVAARRAILCQCQAPSALLLT